MPARSMPFRFIARLATLLFGVAAASGCAGGSDSPCDVVSCAPGQRCFVASEGLAVCADPCLSSQSCSADAPVCDPQSGACRPCVAGEERLCAEHSADSHRCVAGRCVACVAPRGPTGESTDCTSGGSLSTAPVCDHNLCRPCRLHSECTSGVCAKDPSGVPFGIPVGSCVPAEQILVVDQDLCSSTGPVFCTPQQAFDHVNLNQRYVLLRKGAHPSDFTNLVLGRERDRYARPVHVIGPLADQSPQHPQAMPPLILGAVPGGLALTVVSGNIELEGFLVTGSMTGVSCTGDGTGLQIRRSFFSGNAIAVSASSGCQLLIDQSWIGSGPARTGFDGLPGNPRGVEIAGADFQIVNSVFVDDGDYRQDAIGGIHIYSASPGTAVSTVVNTTFHQLHGIVRGGNYLTTLVCDTPLHDRLLFMNSLFFSDQALLESPVEHYLDPNCGAALANVGANDAALTMDPQSVAVPWTSRLFVDSIGRDLRLLADYDPSRQALAKGGAAAVNFQGVMVAAPAVDLDGVARGQGGKPPAIGAFEPVPAPAP